MRRWAPMMATGAAVALAACAPRLGFAPRSAVERLPVLLILEGDPLPARDARRVVEAISARIERPVVSVPGPVLDEAALRRRLAKSYGRAPSAGWNAERCAVGHAAAEALAHDANAHYRLVLRERRVARQATAAEQKEVSALRRASARLLGAVGLADATGVREVRIDGEMIATTFGPDATVSRLPIEGFTREVATIGDTSLPVADVVADAVASLAPPPYPHWDALARRLLARGCPLAALAIYDARLRLRPDSRDVLRAALGHGPTRADGTGPVAATTPPAPVATVEPPAARLSCKALCELHMVELCNGDRELWTRNRIAWQATPCGQMRDESFLQECYQRQWVTGTFQEACLRPCEHATDGRARLLHLLQGEGCVRIPPS